MRAVTLIFVVSVALFLSAPVDHAIGQWESHGPRVSSVSDGLWRPNQTSGVRILSPAELASQTIGRWDFSLQRRDGFPRNDLFGYPSKSVGGSVALRPKRVQARDSGVQKQMAKSMLEVQAERFAFYSNISPVGATGLHAKPGSRFNEFSAIGRSQSTARPERARIFDYQGGFINPYYPYPVDTPRIRPGPVDYHEGWVTKYLYTRPTVSPYLSLLRHDLTLYGTTRYHQFVVPVLAERSAELHGPALSHYEANALQGLVRR